MADIRKIENNTDIDRLFNKTCTSAVRSSFIEIGDDNFCLPVYYEDYEEQIRKLKIRDDDVFLFGHAKSGTTWATELIWLIVNDFDYDRALAINIHHRFPIIEVRALFDMEVMFKNYTEFMPPPMEVFEEIESPRLLKSHLAWPLLPEEIRNGSKQPKMIVTLRNPEDTCVSMFHYSQTVEGYTGTFEEFCELFLGGRVCYGPFWKHVRSFWNERHRSNILFITYKDMKNDLADVIRKVAKFLEKDITEEQVVKLKEHLSFDSMKNNPNVNMIKTIEIMKDVGVSIVDNDFIRTGSLGGYKSRMSPEMIARFDAWSKENTEDIGLNLY